MSTVPSTIIPTIGGHPDKSFMAALAKVSPQMQQKLKSKAQDFEAVFIGSMFSQMTEGLTGDGPFGGTPGTAIWRSMMTDEFAKSYARSGGIGLSKEVFRSMIMHQAATHAA